MQEDVIENHRTGYESHCDADLSADRGRVYSAIRGSILTMT